MRILARKIPQALLIVALGGVVGCDGCRSGLPPAETVGESEGSAESEGSSAVAVDEAVIPSNAVAVVAGEVVMTTEELEAEVNRLVESFEALPDREPTNASWRNQRRRSVLDEAINSAVIRAYVAEQDIEVSDEEVAEYIEANIGHVYANDRLFQRFLTSRGVTRAEYEEEERMRLEEERILEERGSIEPTEEELQEFYDRNRSHWSAGERVHASTIVVRLRSTASEAEVEQAREQIEAIRAEVLGGRDFAEVAIEQSQGAEAHRGGDMGWVIRGRFPQLAEDGVEELLFAAEPGTITDPVRTRLGWQFFVVAEHREAGIREFDEVRHVIYEPLRRQKTERLRQQLVEQLRDEVPVERFEDRLGLEAEE